MCDKSVIVISNLQQMNVCDILHHIAIRADIEAVRITLVCIYMQFMWVG